MTENSLLDGDSTPGVGHNLSPQALDRERVDNLVEAANKWIAGVPEILDPGTASRAQTFIRQLDAEIKRLKIAEGKEKKALRDRIAEIAAGYALLLKPLEMARRLLIPKRQAWIDREQRRLDAEKAAERKEADRLAAEAIAAAHKTASGQPTVEQAIHAEEMYKLAAEAAKVAALPPERAVVRDIAGGRAASMRVRWTAEIKDFLQVYLYYQDHADVRACLAKLANAEAATAHREGRPIPGCILVPKESVA